MPYEKISWKNPAPPGGGCHAGSPELISHLLHEPADRASQIFGVTSGAASGTNVPDDQCL